jgi:hypothetical protein
VERKPWSNEGDGATKGDGASLVFGGGLDELAVEVTGPFLADGRAIVFPRKMKSTMECTAKQKPRHTPAAVTATAKTAQVRCNTVQAGPAIIMREGEPTKQVSIAPGGQLSRAPPAASSPSACQAQSLPLPHKEYSHIYPCGWMNFASDEHCSSTNREIDVLEKGRLTQWS